MLAVFNLDDCLAEGRDHIELLENAIHVADAAEILQANKTRQGTFLLLNMDRPVDLSRGAPKSLVADILLEVICDEKFVIQVFV